MASQKPAAPSTPRPGSPARKVAAAVGVAALFSVGMLLLALSFTQEVSHVGHRTLSGMLDLGLSVDEVDFEEFSYAEVSWGDPKCGLRFHFLSVLDYQEYVDRGTLPAAAINCDRVTAVVDGSTSHIAIGNDREPAANYTLEFDLFVIHRPLGWLGLVALPLLSVASFIAVIALLRKTLVDLLRRPPLQQERK